MVVPLVERYAEQIPGMLSCFDRVVITGTLPAICHASAAAWVRRRSRASCRLNVTS